MQSTQKIARAALIAALILALCLPSEAKATCTGSFLNPISDVCWECIFPIKIAGMEMGSSNMADAPDMAKGVICMCPAPPPIFVRVGVPLAFWEPARYVETVKDPFCFPSMGFQLDNPFSANLGGGGDEIGNQEETSTFTQAHWFIFPAWAMLELLVDFICVEHSGFDLAYITEVDPLWNNDMLAFIINPEALLFANPIAQLACVADSVSSLVWLSLPPLFWCMGSWGSAYPLSGHVNDDDLVQANAATGARMIYKLGRELLLWDPGIWLCAAVPTPIWLKWNYRMQIAKPIRGMGCMPIGRTDLMWGFGKNPPFVGDNFVFIIFRKRACCAF